MKFPKIKTITAVRNYVLHVTFSDGVEGNYDAGLLAGKGVFKSWDKDDNFYKVYIDKESGAISWPGELDLDTINIYCAIKGISPEFYLTQKYHAAY